MKNKRQKGFVLILVIVVMALIGIQMFALADIANTMQFQSHTQYLTACERNLLASGKAWARQNIPPETGDILNEKEIDLDVRGMNIRGAALTVTVNTSRTARHMFELTADARAADRLSKAIPIGHGFDALAKRTVRVTMYLTGRIVRLRPKP